jgi:indolepyruvate ferredoxin oxidoreductase beta subunit
MLEAYRALPYLKIGGHIISNTQEINPMPVITGAMEYPKDIDKKLAKVANTTFVDSKSLSKEAGNINAVNVVLLGVMAKKMDISYDKWVEAIKTTVPAKLLDVNLKAFELGYNSK